LPRLSTSTRPPRSAREHRLLACDSCHRCLTPESFLDDLHCYFSCHSHCMDVDETKTVECNVHLRGRSTREIHQSHNSDTRPNLRRVPSEQVRGFLQGSSAAIQTSGTTFPDHLSEGPSRRSGVKFRPPPNARCQLGHRITNDEHTYPHWLSS
jgi:hypothetical protein